MWAKQWLLRRDEINLSHLLEELRKEPEDYSTFLRMDEACFEKLLTLVTPLIERQATTMRTPERCAQ